MFLRRCSFEQVSSISYSNVAVFVSQQRSAAAAHKVSIVGNAVMLGHTPRRRDRVFWRVQEGNINAEKSPGDDSAHLEDASSEN